MVFRVRLFAVLRERAGAETVEVELPEGGTVADALASLARRGGPLSTAIEELPLVMAVNRSYAERDTVLEAGDELALIPPVSGGGGPHVAVVEQRLSSDRLERLVATAHTGAIVTFQGTTRDVDHLDYEAYVPMAEERMAAILEEVRQAHEIEGAAAEHRIGIVPLGEASVVVAVAAAHRGPAFAAAREAIDRIKAEAPIWKREVEGERSEWVDGTEPPAGPNAAQRRP
jgi:molybdopterin synthase catalytic subunit